MTLIERAEDMRKILQIGVAWRVGRAVIDVEQAREYERAIAALLDIHDAARAMLQEEYPPQEAENRARLCMALNACDRGVAEHDWGEWRGPYVASGGDVWQSRSCRTCGEHDARRMPKDGDA